MISEPHETRALGWLYAELCERGHLDPAYTAPELLELWTTALDKTTEPGDGHEPRTDLHDEVDALCRALELEPSRVCELVLTPRLCTATFYLLNDEGAKYVDLESNTAALGRRTYRITT